MGCCDSKPPRNEIERQDQRREGPRPHHGNPPAQPSQGTVGYPVPSTNASAATGPPIALDHIEPHSSQAAPAYRVQSFASDDIGTLSGSFSPTGHEEPATEPIEVHGESAVVKNQSEANSGSRPGSKTSSKGKGKDSN